MPTREGAPMLRLKFVIIGGLAAFLAIPSSADAQPRGVPSLFGIMTAPLRMMMGIPRARFALPGRHYRRAAVRPHRYYRHSPRIAAPAAVAPPAAVAAVARPT